MLQGISRFRSIHVGLGADVVESSNDGEDLADAAQTVAGGSCKCHSTVCPIRPSHYYIATRQDFLDTQYVMDIVVDLGSVILVI